MKLKVLLVASSLLLAACTAEESEVKEAVIQQEEESLVFDIGQAQEIKDVVSYEVLNLSSTESVSPPNPGSVTTVLSVEKPDSRFLDLSVNLKNLGTADKSVGELLDITYIIGEKEYSTFKRYEADNASMLKDAEFSTIEPLTNNVVHYIAEVPNFESTEEIQIDAVINGKTYTTVMTLEQLNTNRNFISIGEMLEVPQYANLTLEKVYYTDKVSPPNPGSVSTYYEPDAQSNTFLVLEMKVKNLKSSGIQADSIAAAKVVFNQYYEFDGFPVLLKSDASGYDYANITSIPSLNENVLIYIIEVPKELKGTEGVLSIWFNNTYYHFPVDNQISSQQLAVKESPETADGSNSSPDSSDTENSEETQDSETAEEATETEDNSNEQSETTGNIKKGHTQMTTQETLDLISYNEGIDFSTHSHNMYFDANGYLVIEVGQGEMAVGTYKIDGDGTLLQLDVSSGLYIPAEQVTDGGS